jgi:GT2 family glycosyltransferase
VSTPAETSRPAVDAVVVAYRSAATLRACVEPLAGAPGVTVTVVDNASPDDEAAGLAGLDVRLVHAPSNGGFASGSNLGVRQGAAPYILLLNPDARLAAADLDRLVSVLERDPAIGIAGPRILDSDGTTDPSQRRFPRAISTFAQALFLHRLLPHAGWTDELVRADDAYEQPASPDWISGACMLVRRELYERIGGLDEGFFLYCEDMDLCARVRSLGLDVRYEPAAVAHHVGGASAPGGSLLPVLARSRVRYAAKHRGALAVRTEAAGVALGAATHALTAARRPVVRRGQLASFRLALRLLVAPAPA